MKHYSLAHETEVHYVLHDKRDGRLFHIAKKGIDKNTSDTIKSLPAMKQFNGYDNDKPDSRDIPGTDARPVQNQPQHYAEGGNLKEDYSLPPMSEHEVDLGPEPSPTPAPQEERREKEMEVHEQSQYASGGHVLDANARKHIAAKNFAGPDRSYPIEDAAHARNALARVAQHGSSELQAKVRAKVHAKYPSIGASNGAEVATGGLVNTSMSPYTHAKLPMSDGGKVAEMRALRHPAPEYHFDQGGQTPPPQTPVESAQDSMRKAFHFADGVDPVPAAPDQTAQEINQEIEHPAPESPQPQPEAPPGDVGAPSNMVQEDIAAQEASVPQETTSPTEETSQETSPKQSTPVTETPMPVTSTTGTLAEKAATGQSDLDRQLQENSAKYQSIMDKQKEDDARFSNLVASKKLDPNRFYNNQNLGQKIFMSLGLALGGVGSGMTGGPNQALQVINDAINRDIDAQKNDQSNSMNLWKMNHESLRDQQAATLQTRNQILEAAKVSLDELMGTAPGPMAMQKAAALKTQLSAEQMQNQFSIARSKMMQSVLQDQDNSGHGESTKDPAAIVPYLVPPDQQKVVFQEIQDAQNITTNGPKILKAFDQATKDKSLGSMKVNPASINALHQLMLPLFKDVDGTVRQAAMDESFNNLTPQLLDSSQKDATRRQALVDWITSKHAAPTAKGYGIDLSKYSSTAENVGGQIKKMNGAAHQQVPGGWKRIK